MIKPPNIVYNLMKRKKYGCLLIACMAVISAATAQERTAPVNYNPVLKDGYKAANAAHKATALSLPFFEDFTGSSPYPDAGKWVEHQVYVNNTMCISPVSRGVATFDALNDHGIPYDTASANTLVNADSLTSQPIDLSSSHPSDSIYISFFYQPGGNGFYPRAEDSLMLYLKRANGVWEKAWAVPGSTPQPFKQAMVVVDSDAYFHNDFQFRFVNKAAINTSDDVWNLDYIRMGTNRGIGDTAVDDVAFTSDPAFMLNDYTSMPYRQFMANEAGELASQQYDSIRNNYPVSQTVNCSYTARETATGTPLFSSPVSSSVIGAKNTQGISFPTYTPSFPSPGNYDKVVFENKFFFPLVNAGEPHDNDTIIKQQVFDNYLAYDDGTAELSYYLNLFSSLPGKIAIEYHLNQPDTLRGIAIYFGRQVPMASNKLFSVAVYSALQGINNAPSNILLHQEDLLQPQYGEVNQYWVYSLNSPVALQAGTFYMGTIQPAFSGADSLYFGLDVNRLGGNHAYYDVLGTWNSSSISGAIMMRPLLGQTVFNTNTEDRHLLPSPQTWSMYPNPAADHVSFYYTSQKSASYELTDMQGRIVMKGSLGNGKDINIQSLRAGIYLVRLSFDGVTGAPQKIIKQ